jgi:antitoxin-like ribbon-helix-helix protein
MKKASLSQGLVEVSGRPAPLPAAKPEAAAHPGVTAPSRAGKKAIAGFFDPAISRQLKEIGLEKDACVQALLAEALND